MPSNRTDLKALKNLITETDLILSTATLPEKRTARCRELLRAALALTDDLIGQAKLTPAAIMGHKGGSTTAKRGPEYFKKIAGMRKTRAGGRPRTKPKSI